MKIQIAKCILGLALCGAASTASAQSFYPIIDPDLYGQGGGFGSVIAGNADNDITATFTASSGGELDVNNFGTGTFANINGLALLNPVAGDNLDVSFSSAITSFQMNWAAATTDGASIMDISAYLNGDLVGTSVSTSSDPLMWDEGSLLYDNSGGFNSLVIGLDPTVGAGAGTGQWAIGTDVAGTGNFGNQTTVPEPSTMALVGLGGASLLLYRRRK